MAASTKAVVSIFHEPDSHTAQYLVVCPQTKACAVIDSVLEYDLSTGCTSTAEVDKIIAAIAEQGLRCEWVLDTHAHADHVSGARYVQSKVGGKTAIGERIRTVQELFKRVFNLDDVIPDGRDFDRLFADGDTFRIGNLDVQVLHTPGHTPACVSYYIPNDCVFVGDTIFMPDMGTARCDFPGGSSATLWDSIQRLFRLPDDTRLFTGHDYAPGRDAYAFESTIAAQKASNKHVHVGVEPASFTAWRAERDAALGLPNLFVPALQLNIRGARTPQPEQNGIAYLKWPLNLFDNLKPFLAFRGSIDRLSQDYHAFRGSFGEQTMPLVRLNGPYRAIANFECATDYEADDPLRLYHDREASLAASEGLAYAAVPISKTSSDAELGQAIAALESLPKPVLLRCRSGLRAAVIGLLSIAKQQGLRPGPDVDELIARFSCHSYGAVINRFLAAQ